MSTRTLFPAGPAFITAAGITIELADDWKAESEIVSVPMGTNLFGVVGESESYVITKITGKAIATSTNLLALWAFLNPYDPSMLGQNIFPATDLPLVIQTSDGKSITYPAHAVTKMAGGNFAPNVDFFNEFEITCIRAGGVDVTTAASVATVATSAYTAPLTYPLARIRSPYGVAWGGSSPFSAIQTDKTGVKFSPTVKLENVEPMLYGLYNMRIAEVTATAKFMPMNLTAADFFNFIKLSDASAGVGSVTGQRGLALTVTSVKVGDPLLTIPLAVPTQGPLAFDYKSRVGEVTLQAHRKSVSGVIQPLFTFAAVA